MIDGVVDRESGAERAADLPLRLAEFMAERCELALGTSGALDDEFALGREANALAGADDDLAAQFALDGFDALGKRRLRKVQTVRCVCDVAALSERVQ